MQVSQVALSLTGVFAQTPHKPAALAAARCSRFLRVKYSRRVSFGVFAVMQVRDGESGTTRLGTQGHFAILAAANEPAAMEQLRLPYSRALDIVSRGLPDEEGLLRAGFVASQFVGMAMMPYVWRIGPLATISREHVVAFITPVIERYLNEPLREERKPAIKSLPVWSPSS
jgi:hypothetical protein